RRRARLGALLAGLSRPLSPHLPPLFLVLFSVAAYLALEAFTGIKIFSAICLGTGTYGLLGLYLPKPTWKRGLPLAALGLLLMPFRQHLDVYLGFPLRMLSVQCVEHALKI